MARARDVIRLSQDRSDSGSIDLIAVALDVVAFTAMLAAIEPLERV